QRGVPCADKSRTCPQYLALGYCEKKYVLFMYKNCKKTCGRCHDGNPYATDVDVGPLSRRVIRTKPCTNALKGCNYWARIGYCSMRPDLMLRKCKLACRACHPEKKCENIVDDHNCNHWAKLGKCSSRMNFMIEKCPKSCNACPS
ncbi:putative tyrosinase-like protein tyr-3, partial [Exaiptasia diaphana]